MDITYVYIIIRGSKKKLKLNSSRAQSPGTEEKL